MSLKTLKQIAVDLKNYQRLQQMGVAGESFNTVITRLINEALRHHEGGTPHDANSNPPDLGRLQR